MIVQTYSYSYGPEGTGPWRVTVTTVRSPDPRLRMGGFIDCPDEKTAEAVMAALATVEVTQ